LWVPLPCCVNVNPLLCTSKLCCKPISPSHSTSHLSPRGRIMYRLCKKERGLCIEDCYLIRNIYTRKRRIYSREFDQLEIG
jgi:hypothetical protein